jgi:uncharacterized repeat protein (TIGR01451 family)
MKERSHWLRTRMVRPGAGVLLAAAFALGLAAWGRWADVAYSQGQGCAVYPIVLHEDTLTGAREGDIFLDIFNGVGEGNFGWLAWNDNPGSQTASALADRIAYPGNSTDPIDGYTNPSDPTDHEIQIGDWIWGHTGAVNSNVVRNALDDHVDAGRTLRIPVWDAANCDGAGTECEGDAPGGGAAVTYRVSGFALVKLLWHDLAQKMIALEFLRWDNSCGQGGGVDTCDPYFGLYASQTGSYGLEQASNLAVFGPRICTSFGDAYTPYNSPWYDELNGVYSFRLDIPSDYESKAENLTLRWNGGADTNDIVRVEIWDPDCYNRSLPGNQFVITNTVTGLPMTISNACSGGGDDRKQPCVPLLRTQDPQNPFGFVRIDENRGGGSPPGNGTCAEPGSYTPGFNTVTEYTLYYYLQQGDGSVERRNLARYTKGGAESDSDTDMRWVSPGGSLPGDPVPDGWVGSPYGFAWDAGNGNFEIDLSTEAPDIYVNPLDSRRSLFLDVRGAEGASENGFDLWAGPRYQTVPGEVNARNVDIVLYAGDYHSSAGATIFGIGHLTMNTNATEVVTFTLAYIPPEWAGRTLYVSSFDNDAGGTGLTFIFDTIPYTDWYHDGLLSRNNAWYTNVLTVPSEPEHTFYGGFLQAIYQAGAHDTFGWMATIPQPDLSGSTKEASGTTVTPGDVLTYTIVVSNIGMQDAPAASLSEPIPGHTAYVTGSARTDPPGSGVLTETASALEWSGSVAVQEVITLTFQVTVDPDVAEGTEITNTVAISYGACGCYHRAATVLVEAPAQPLHELYLPLILKRWPAVHAPTVIPSLTATATEFPSTAGATPTGAVTPTPTNTPTNTPTGTPTTETPTVTGTPTSTATPPLPPTAGASPTPTNTSTATPTPTNTSTPTWS